MTRATGRPTAIRRRTACALLCSFLLCGSACAAEQGSGVIRVGMTAFALPEQRSYFEAATEAAIRSVTDIPEVVVTHYTVDGLVHAVTQGRVDVFVSSAGAARRLSPTGARPLATSVAPGLEDPNHNEGTAIILRADDPRTLEELEGSSVAANLPYGFSGYQIAMAEIARLGFNPDTFFGRSRFFRKSAAMDDVARSVVSGETEVGFLRLCAWESIEARHPELTRALRVLPAPEDVEGKVACRHSTRLYPAQSISVMPTVSPELSRRLLVALLTMPPTEDGRAWSVATDFQAVDRLLQDLRIGPYSYLRQWTVRRVVETYWGAILASIAVVIGLFLHGWRLRVLVRRREAELDEAHSREASQAIRIATLQRAGAVSQLSSLIAHEVHQPLAAIRLFAEGLARRAAAGQSDPAKVEKVALKIAAQAQRASDVVDRVRDFARDREPKFHPIRSRELVDHLRTTYSNLDRKITVECPDEADAWIVRGSLLELELALVNLIRNALQAASASEKTAVVLCVAADDESVTFTVEDNGPAISAEKLEALSSPITSEKPSGLGLGLAIVKHLVERHSGTLTFTPVSGTDRNGAPRTGLAAAITLARLTAADTQQEQNTQTELP